MGGGALQGAASGALGGAALGPFGALGGAALGFIGGQEAENKQNAYEQQQQQALDADQARRNALVGSENAAYGPIRQQLTQEAANPMPLNYGANLGQINQQTQNAQQGLDANMAKRGLTGSGLQASGMQGLQSGRVGELAKAFDTGMNARRQLGMNLLQHYNPLGDASLQTGALGQQMHFGQSEQDLYNKSMQQGYGAVGKGLGGFLSGFNPGAQGSLGGTAGPSGTAIPGFDQNNDMTQAVLAQGNGIDSSGGGGQSFYDMNGGIPLNPQSETFQSPMAQMPSWLDSGGLNFNQNLPSVAGGGS